MHNVDGSRIQILNVRQCTHMYTNTGVYTHVNMYVYMYISIYTYSTAQMQSITNARYERVCAFTKTRLRVRRNAFARSTKRVCAFNKTRLSGPNERVRTTRYAPTKLLMTFDPHKIRKTYKVTVEREINVAASAY